jgi:ketosteroid isomerase-like protein
MAFLEESASVGMDVAARNHAAENVTWWMPGSLRSEPLTRRTEVVDWFETRGAGTKFHEPPKIEVEEVLVQGEVAAAHVRASGSTMLGKQYDNHYVFLVTVEHGKITEMREFFDTKHVLDTFHSEPADAR